MAETALLDRLPEVAGTLEAGVPLSRYTWFRVGGPAEVLFLPRDEADLSAFLAGCPADVTLTVVGVGSNLLVRDGGIRGVVIRLGPAFARIEIGEGERVTAGAGALDAQVARKAAQAGIAGLEFLAGIPGSLGGALTMNAGAYGAELKDVLVEAVALDREGKRHVMPMTDLHLSYRASGAPAGLIYTSAVLRGRPGDPDRIRSRIEEIMAAREESQPIRARTGGSTFKNPDPARSGGRKSWQLIDAAGCRGLVEGDAQVSEQHCNFLINRGAASAADLEKLGETVRRRVREATGVALDWEIRRIGDAAPGEVLPSTAEGGAR